MKYMNPHGKKWKDLSKNEAKWIKTALEKGGVLEYLIAKESRFQEIAPDLSDPAPSKIYRVRPDYKIAVQLAGMKEGKKKTKKTKKTSKQDTSTGTSKQNKSKEQTQTKSKKKVESKNTKENNQQEQKKKKPTTKKKKVKTEKNPDEVKFQTSQGEQKGKRIEEKGMFVKVQVGNKYKLVPKSKIMGE